ncbi:baculoviral IAP repeat-containing protein 1f-like isoform X2 [Acanthaster planci]|uniref:Baculoviral IAP repeat-containing protein 1f-like isoform X2 n=1 Tax=Acanthaster planci TaxID=133434 RepID=A0A8B7XXR0_ACAPL|nr:baculoviral IAP repeat-containing protein 1f-like isoform X2 [Acanthaster planci]
MAELGERQASGSRSRDLEDALWQLAGELGQSWMMIGRALDFTEARLQNLQMDYPADAHERAYQMLLKWKNKTTPSERSQQLRGALEKAERLDLMYFVSEVTTHDTVFEQVVWKKGLDKETFCKKLKSFVQSKMSKLPLVPWITTGCVNVEQVFTNVQLLISIMAAYFPIKLPLQSYNAIFKDVTREDEGLIDFCGARILMRGRTGSGKTTLLTKYAYDWATGKSEALLRNAHIVLVLPMRKLDQHSNLGQAVLDHMLPNERRITPEEIEQYCEDHPEEVVILLDGYDEFKGKGLDQADCGNIVKMLRGEWLTECRVVVTTRPGRVDDFKDDYESYRHLEITGFTPKDIDDYVHKIFRGENKPLGDKLLVYLEENRLKEELASIPLMLTAFCQLAKWTDGKDFNELNTISKLFDRLIECVFKHDHSKVAKKRFSSGAFVPGLLDPEKLVLELGKVALNGFFGDVTEELIFSEEDFSRCSNQAQVILQGLRAGVLSRDGDSNVRPQNFEDLGLKGQKPSTTRDISFILKSIQEKCAGKYLAHLLDSGDKNLFTHYLQKVDTDQQVLDYTNILVFASAASIEAARHILSYVIALLRDTQGQNISQYLSGKLHFRHCQKIQRLIETCLQLNFESNSEGRFNHMFNSLFGDSGCVRLVGMSTYVAKALGYLFAHSCQGKLCREPNSYNSPPIERCALSARSLQLICIKLDSSTQFREFLNCYPGTEEAISNFMGDSVKPQSQNDFGSLRKKLQTSEQKIPNYLGNRDDLTFFAVVPIWQEVSKHQVQDFSLGFVISGLKESSLDELVLNGVSADRKDWNVLFNMIQDGVFAQMTRLTLSLNDLTFDQSAHLATALVATPNLKYLKMAGNELGESFVENLPQMLQLENVILDKSKMPSKAIVEFMKKLDRFPQLKRLDLRRNENTDDEVIQAICNSLSSRQTWKELRLSLYKTK